jgi:O-antigen/teichoic acid export membrane protein
MGIKEQAISGVLWSSIGKLSSMGIEFIVGIILARLLSPKEFD